MTRRLSPALVLCLLAACGSEPPPPGPPAPTVPEVDLSLVTERRLLDGIREAQAAVEANPRSAAGWGRLGGVYTVHGWVEAGAACYAEAARLEPDQACWPYLRGRSLESLDAAAALEAYHAAADRADAEAPILLHRAALLRQVGRGEEARADLERVAAILPDNPMPHVGLGQIAFGLGRLDEARRHLERALALRGDVQQAHRTLAQVLQAQGDEEGAQRHSEAGEAAGPPVPLDDPCWARAQALALSTELLVENARLHSQRGDDEAAVAVFADVLTAHVAEPAPWFDYGDSLRRLGRLEDALAAYQRCLELAEAPGMEDRLTPENHARIHTNLGFVHVRLGRPELAEAEWRQALTHSPGHAEAARNLGLLLVQLGRTEEALAELERALALTDDEALVQLHADIVRDTAGGG